MTEADENNSRQRAVSAADRDVYSVQHDWADETPIGTTVVKAVSAVSGVRPTDLEPLHSVLDTDALERLFEPTADGPRPQQNYVHFPVSEHDITVYADGVVVVEGPKRDDGDKTTS